MVWTEEMVENLKKMWMHGLSTSEIAKKLGVSKNAIVGKVHRLNLSCRPSPIKKKDEIQKPVIKKAVKHVAKPEKNAVQEEKLQIEKIKENSSLEQKQKMSGDTLIRLTDLDSHTCRWPLGDPRDENFHFCGKKVRTGQTYCDEHAAIAYVKPIKK